MLTFSGTDYYASDEFYEDWKEAHDQWLYEQDERRRQNEIANFLDSLDNGRPPYEWEASEFNDLPEPPDPVRPEDLDLSFIQMEDEADYRLFGIHG